LRISKPEFGPTAELDAEVIATSGYRQQ